MALLRSLHGGGLNEALTLMPNVPPAAAALYGAGPSAMLGNRGEGAAQMAAGPSLDDHMNDLAGAVGGLKPEQMSALKEALSAKMSDPTFRSQFDKSPGGKSPAGKPKMGKGKRR